MSNNPEKKQGTEQPNAQQNQGNQQPVGSENEGVMTFRMVLERAIMACITSNNAEKAGELTAALTDPMRQGLLDKPFVRITPASVPN